MINEETRQDFVGRYAKLVSNHTIWLLTARRLYASANIIGSEIRRRWDDQDFRKPDAEKNLIRDAYDVSDFQPTFMMLAASALENLFKAHVVRQNAPRFRQIVLDTGELPKVLWTHNLQKLAKSCDIITDGDVGSRLDRLAKFSTWRGRYHFAKKFETFYHLTPQNDIPSSGVAYSSTDTEDIPRFLESLAKTLGFNINKQADA